MQQGQKRGKHATLPLQVNAFHAFQGNIARIAQLTTTSGITYVPGTPARPPTACLPVCQPAGPSALLAFICPPAQLPWPPAVTNTTLDAAPGKLCFGWACPWPATLAGLTKFADMSPEEFRTKMLSNIPTSKPAQQTPGVV